MQEVDNIFIKTHFAMLVENIDFQHFCLEVYRVFGLKMDERKCRFSHERNLPYPQFHA